MKQRLSDHGKLEMDKQMHEYADRKVEDVSLLSNCHCGCYENRRIEAEGTAAILVRMLPVETCCQDRVDIRQRVTMLTEV